MDRSVTEYHGIKYSLQTHGPKSRLMMALAFFVAAFGGTLLATTSASADDDVVAGVIPSISAPPLPELTLFPSPSSSPTPEATPAPAPAVTVTVTVTKTVTRTVTATSEPQALGPPLGPIVAPTTPEPSFAPSAAFQSTMSKASSESGSSLIGWGFTVIGVGALLLIGLGVAGIVKRRRYNPRHSADASTEEIPAIPDVDEYNIKDYDPKLGDYDPALGSNSESHPDSSFKTAHLPRVEDDPGNTKSLPKVE